MPEEVAVDGSGNVYVIGSITHNAFKITPGGVITEIIDRTATDPDGCLDRWWFGSLREAREASESWLREYNHERPHGSLDGLTPVEFFELWAGQEREAA